MHDSMKKAEVKVEKMHPVYTEQRNVTPEERKRRGINIGRNIYLDLSAILF